MQFNIYPGVHTHTPHTHTHTRNTHNGDGNGNKNGEGRGVGEDLGNQQHHDRCRIEDVSKRVMPSMGNRHYHLRDLMPDRAQDVGG